jgi:hypothetical protein
MSPTYGPFYPPVLQAAVDHAERLSSVLADMRVARGRGRAGSVASAWLVGRVGEIETFVAQVVDEWRRRAVDERAAAAAVDGYLDLLHAGLRTHFGPTLASLCCVENPSEPTRPLPRTSPSAPTAPSRP